MVSMLNSYLNAGDMPSEESLAECAQDTGGSCRFLSCDASRHAKCAGWSGGYHCICPPGTCAINGECKTTQARGGKRSVGYLNPVLYRYEGSDVFNDITQGSNKCARSGEPCCGGYEAGPGWDPVTGLGTVNFAKVMEILHVTP